MTLTRRRILAALATTGGAGALVGSGTAAMLRDTDRISASITAGTVDLRAEYELLTGPGADDPEGQGTIDGRRVTLPIGALGSDAESGSMRLTFALPQRSDAVNNPAALWLATDCPVPEPTTLAESMQVAVSYLDCSSGSRLDRITAGSLREVAEDLRGGYRIDGDPAITGDDCLVDATCLLIEYDLNGYIGTETADVPLWFAAIQCRNTTPENPFDMSSDPCPTADPCPCCHTIGKLEFEDDTQPGLGDGFADPGVYGFNNGDPDYGLEIYDTVDNNSDETVGIAFRLVRLTDGNAPPICTVAVKGGHGYEQYDRTDGLSADTMSLPGSDSDGIVYAPDSAAISHVTVCVCTAESKADCEGCTDPSLSTSGTRGWNGNNNLMAGVARGDQ